MNPRTAHLWLRSSVVNPQGLVALKHWFPSAFTVCDFGGPQGYWLPFSSPLVGSITLHVLPADSL